MLRSNFPVQIQQARGFDEMVEELLRKSAARDEIVDMVPDNLKAEEAKGNQNPYVQLSDIISNCAY